MRDTAHNILVREGGACPWCGGTAIFTTRVCPEPDGAAEAYDPWDDPEEEEDADALVLMALTWGDELRAIRRGRNICHADAGDGPCEHGLLTAHDVRADDAPEDTFEAEDYWGEA